MAQENYTPTAFSTQQVFEILLLSPIDNSIIAYLDDLKSSKFINEGTLVYPTGARGNVYIGGAFGHSKRSRIEVQKATWNSSVTAYQSGTEVVVGSNTNTYQYDRKTVISNSATPTFTAIGTTGSEIGTINILSSDGSKVSTLIQAATPATGKFSYNSTTNIVTFYTGEVADNTIVEFAYRFDSGSSAQTIDITTDGFPSTVKVVAYGLAKHLKTGELYKMQVQGTAQIDPAWTWDLASDGNPAVQDLKLEFTKTGLDKKLSSIIIYNDADAI